jgi:tetratricopeptide (TPR) repeat protein
VNELHIHTLLEEAAMLAEEGKRLHAIQLYTRLLGSDPSLEEPSLRLARLFAEQGDLESAERVVADGLDRHPGHWKFIICLGDLAAAQEKYGQAAGWYGQLSEHRLPRLHFSLGMVYLRMRELEKAEGEFRRTLRLDSRFPRIHESLGEVLLERGDVPQAIVEFRKALRHDPYSGDAHRFLGAALKESHQWAAALEEFILAVDIDPDDAKAWQLSGEALLHLRRYGEAEYYVRRARALDPGSADVAASCGFVCMHNGKVDEARQAFQDALTLRPGHPRAMDGILHLSLRSEHL